MINSNSQIVNVWTQEVCNLKQSKFSNRWGLGDLLRGSFQLFQICSKLNIPFTLDYNKHPLSQLFEYKADCNLNITQDNRFIKFSSKIEMETFVKLSASSGQKFIPVVTNGFGIWTRQYLSKFRLFIKPFLNLSPEWEAKALIYLPKAMSYRVLHLRLGDPHLIASNIHVTMCIDNIMRKYLNADTVLVSDSPFAKKYAMDKYNANVFAMKSVHTGISKSSEDLFDTYLEWMLIARSRKIVSFSNYTWTSGFVKSASLIYGVPLFDLKCKLFPGRISTSTSGLWREVIEPFWNR